ncbi:hypothetical protein B5864_13835 [Salmonella enterica]|uniref:Uncharacterized protein n=2 Tax=Salmonella enterica TaxID=28901 RepID=A0A403T227_SALER|nr:hypothetical protein [Salmonella sp. SG203]EAB7739574.1 hypothetical protein [Salmonella enterica subsp. enterica serovar Hadar]EAV6574941.1 hypothetical protein [Salmonella enterica]EBQ9003897.1 hypothetical protein [Salmonella enterica subsp. enterica serovar Blockley]EBR8258968.1 hypothetical protein [Salmonella enterica subsp. enterica serovar Cerro]EBW7251980.1 hypothetical protein [Salmonella enterica subsp. enterica serovar Gatow]EBX7469045.1 hypothetical protein [Salmonella enteric
MTILTDIYNRLDVIDDLIELQKPYFHHGQIISDQITALIGYVEHVTAVMKERQRRHKLTDIEAGYILPALDEINTLMSEKLSKGEKPDERLSDKLTDLIGLVGWWILHIENRDAGRVSR